MGSELVSRVAGSPLFGRVAATVLASVWIGYGLFAKLLGLVPRHREIVARFVGDEPARWLTPAIGVLEVGMALWILSGRRRRIAAAAQTAAIVPMNALELTFARDLLLHPILMPVANGLLLALAWTLALAPAEERA